MNATPRPWSWFADVRKDGVKVARIGGGTPADDLGLALKHDDADLIVTAVNEYDARVARVVAQESVLAEVRRLRDEWRNERPETWAEIHTGLVGLAEASRDAIVADLNAILDKYGVPEVPEGEE